MELPGCLFEYLGEVGGVYLCGLNTCMGEDGEAWLIWPGAISVSNISSLKEGVKIKFSSVRFDFSRISCH